ncbi:hypothetical protein K3179_11290 [Qipengyuania sp. GH38]|uniref:hypothetical protein n=1 Tax=Qipengyuania intermedia TaxID=2867244 RepID=UPI001C87BD2F|nr:hypothetical protein [Qipengyuania intermedia]MBX7515127.1 hypothetical protein [Qipengyuania intermedia]
MRLAAIAAGLTILAAPAFAGQQEVPAETRADAPKPEAKEEAEKVCKYIRADMSSRRKQKVCMTEAEWIEFNRGN